VLTPPGMFNSQTVTERGVDLPSLLAISEPHSYENSLQPKRRLDTGDPHPTAAFIPQFGQCLREMSLIIHCLLVEPLSVNVKRERLAPAGVEAGRQRPGSARHTARTPRRMDAGYSSSGLNAPRRRLGFIPMCNITGPLGRHDQGGVEHRD
jgi:hypothetical protein